MEQKTKALSRFNGRDRCNEGGHSFLLAQVRQRGLTPTTTCASTDSFLVGFFEEAVTNVVGKVFAKPLTLGDDVPPKIEEDVWPNVDLAGATADVFLYGVGVDATVNGISFVLVDMPTSSRWDAYGGG